MPDHDSPFSQRALPTNQSGRLSDEQAQRWAAIAKGRRQSVRGVALPFAAIGALLLFANFPSANVTARTNGGIVFFGIAAILLVAANFEPVNADVREGRVESVEGAISKSSRSTTKVPGSRHYLLHVGGRRLQALSRLSYDAAPDAGYVRVYFFPRSKRVVNLEQLADPAIPTGSGAAQEVVQDFARAVLTRDRTTIAEASARVAALQHVIEGPPPRASADGRDRSSSRLRAEDLYGTWTNPALTVTFMKNGIATITMAFGGTRRDGHWSIDVNGRLLTDASGNLEPLDATLNGNQLTIVIEGQRMAFTRTS
jgi:hypothetical protein